MGYAVNEAFRSFKERKTTTFLTVGVITASLFIIGLFLLVTVNLLEIIDTFKTRVEISVFLKDEINKENIEKLRKEILTIGGVEEIVFISKEKAMEEFSKELKDTPELLSAIKTNPLPASFRIKLEGRLKTKETVAKISSMIENMHGVEEVRYGKEAIERLQKIITGGVILDLILGIALGLASIFVVSNTIKLALIARGDAIDIMKLVGAKSGFIRRPFLLEGFFYGLFGGFFASCVLFGLYKLVTIKFHGIIFPAKELVGGIVIFGCVLGYIGSAISIRKFLKM